MGASSGDAELFQEPFLIGIGHFSDPDVVTRLQVDMEVSSPGKVSSPNILNTPHKRPWLGPIGDQLSVINPTHPVVNVVRIGLIVQSDQMYVVADEVDLALKSFAHGTVMFRWLRLPLQTSTTRTRWISL